MRPSFGSLFLPFAVSLTVAMTAAGCASIALPTTPTFTTTSQTFAGTLAMNGAQVQSFTALNAGTVTATLTDSSGVTIGFSLGTWDGTTCRIVLDNPGAAAGAVLTGTASTVASLCVRVYDVGNITGDPIAFTVTIVHP